MVKLKRCNEISDYDAWLIYDSNPYWNENDEDGEVEEVEYNMSMKFRLHPDHIEVNGSVERDYSIRDWKSDTVSDKFTLTPTDLFSNGNASGSSLFKKIVVDNVDKYVDNDEDIEAIKKMSPSELYWCFLVAIFEENDDKEFTIKDLSQEDDGFWLYENMSRMKEAINKESGKIFIIDWLMEKFLGGSNDPNTAKEVVHGYNTLKDGFTYFYITFLDKFTDEIE